MCKQNMCPPSQLEIEKLKLWSPVLYINRNHVWFSKYMCLSCGLGVKVSNKIHNFLFLFLFFMFVLLFVLVCLFIICLWVLLFVK